MSRKTDTATPVSTLRCLLVLDIITTSAAIPLYALSGAMMIKANERLGITSELTGGDLFVGSFLCVYLGISIPAAIICWIGLFNSWSWSRWLYLICTAVSLLLGIAIGMFDISVQWSLPNAVTNLNAVFTGAILALVFFSPISSRFNSQGPE